MGLLGAANASGLSRLIGASNWRRQRLLILCYHGVTEGELHQWNPSLFMLAENFKRRMSLLREARCNVLGLGEAIERLEDGCLPPRSVVLTFDDGFTDFYRAAWPILREYGFPATLYLTTYYMARNLPVFDPALDYLLWKGRGQQLDWPEISARKVFLNLEGRQRMSLVLQTYALQKRLTATQKDGLLEDLAERLVIDYDAFRRSRVLSLINEDEARKLSAEGADLQLHTHRHRTSVHRAGFAREILENRDCMAALGLRPPQHFSYPSGVRRAQDPQWLDELGIKSATTADAGFVTQVADRHSLPRVVDCCPFSEVEFLGWVYGSAALLPHRGNSQKTVAVLEEEETEELPYASVVNR
ncbi:MAG: Polysaccharide deacetylase [Bryobacterales bacterium]|nr:Polysaccharide deacetylase [Bryobacterales bacterium]